MFSTLSITKSPSKLAKVLYNPINSEFVSFIKAIFGFNVNNKAPPPTNGSK